MESLKKFNENELNETIQSNVVGGGRTRPTGPGELCTSATATGCMGFNSDTTDGETTIYHNTWEMENGGGTS